MDYFIKLFQANWLIIILFITPYIGNIFLTDKLKSNLWIYSGNFGWLLVLITSALFSFSFVIPISFYIGFNVFIYLALGLLCWALSGMLTIIIDKADKSGLITALIEWIKTLLVKK